MTVQTLDAAELLGLVKQLAPREQLQFAQQILAGLAQQWPTTQSQKSVRRQAKTTNSLRGIWAGKGFEKIVDLEEELQTVRTELANTILNRDF